MDDEGTLTEGEIYEGVGMLPMPHYDCPEKPLRVKELLEGT